MENPYSEKANDAIESEDVEQTIITNRAGASILAEERGLQVLVDANGTRHSRTFKRLLLGDGQRIITDPTQTYTCACGGALLTKETVAFCEVCQHPACRHHIKKADDGITVTPMCASCFAHGKMKRDALRIARRILRFLQWLTNI